MEQKTKTMKHFLYYLGLFLFLVSGCEKDGTEKRCDKGYTGKNCDQEITPSKIQVTFITATKLPPFDLDGSNWDPLGGKPDVYFKIVEEPTGNVVYKSGAGTDINTTSEVGVDLLNDAVLLNSPTIKYKIQAWDYDDLDDDDFMGGIIFTPYINGQKFPPKRELSCSGCNTAWSLDFTYLF